MQNEVQIASIEQMIAEKAEKASNVRPVHVDWLVWIRGGRVFLRDLRK